MTRKLITRPEKSRGTESQSRTDVTPVPQADVDGVQMSARNRMRRREFLASAGSLVAAAACAGCLGGGGTDDSAIGSESRAGSSATRCPFGLVNDP